MSETEPTAAPDFLTAKELAALVRVSEKTLYRLVRQDSSFPLVKIGGSVRFPRARVLRWIAARTQGGR